MKLDIEKKIKNENNIDNQSYNSSSNNKKKIKMI